MIDITQIIVRKCDYDALQEKLDAAVSFIRVINEELILRGYPGGDREVVLANVRSLPHKSEARLMRKGEAAILKRFILSLDAHKCGECYSEVNEMQRELGRTP